MAGQWTISGQEGNLTSHKLHSLVKLTSQTHSNLVRLNLFNTVNNEERGRGQRSVIWVKCSQPCLHHLQCAQYNVFLTATLFVQPLDHSFTPIPPPFIFPLINQCDRCLAPLEWGLMAGGRRFASYGGRDFVQGLAVPKVEAPEHPGHPPPLSDAVVNS